MELLSQVLDIFLHIDQYLTPLMESHGTLVYALIALIIFCEVGLVIAPFLPGDSMLFAIGALCARDVMDLTVVLTLFPVAAIAGDNFNRLMGVAFGHNVFHHKREGYFFNQRNLARARGFFDQYGAMAVTICRFIPFFRTFVPFVAGLAGMRFRTFLPYSVIGGASWVYVCALAGYYFGNLTFIKEHFEVVILTVVLASAIPAVWRYLKGPKKAVETGAESGDDSGEGLGG